MIKISFEEILEKKTQDSFHDACIERFLYDNTMKKLELAITHFRGQDSNGLDVMFRSTIKFSQSENLIIEGVIEAFFMRPSISSFGKNKIEEEKTKYQIVGNAGWVFEFDAEEIEYFEEMIGVY
jgi:hypothetical protein